MQYYNFYDRLLNGHLLIAGATGTGKSVILNGMIYTMLFQSHKDLNFVLIDPKMVELHKYSNLPHCVGYADNIQDIRNILKSCHDVMMSRYAAMKKSGLNTWTGSPLYIIIDEYADLVLQDKKTIEPLIQSIAQLGRASKVYVILATQYINGIINTRIRCNFVNRVCLRTATKKDSIAVIEKSGTELLPKYGQCILYKPLECNVYNVPMVQNWEIDELINQWQGYKHIPWYKRILSKISRSL